MAIFHSMESWSILSSHKKLPAHIVTLLIIIGAMVVTVVRIFVKSGPIRRNDTMALAMGAKSIIIIAYQLLTEHTRKFRRWASLKANAILNGLEILFWSAVCMLAFQSLTRKNGCQGTACALGLVVVALAILVAKMEGYVFMISYLDFRYFKRVGKPRGQKAERLDDEHALRERHEVPLRK